MQHIVYIFSHVEYTRTCFMFYSGWNETQHQSKGNCGGGDLQPERKYIFLALRSTQTSMLCFVNSQLSPSFGYNSVTLFLDSCFPSVSFLRLHLLLSELLCNELLLSVWVEYIRLSTKDVFIYPDYCTKYAFFTIVQSVCQLG